MTEKTTASKSLPSSMMAVNVVEPGGVDVMRLVRVPVPPAAPGHVLIKVFAAGVNRADVLQRKGLYVLPKGENPNLGLEVAGTVVAVGPGLSRSLNGKNFIALTNGGGYAEFVSVPFAQCMRVPEGLSPVQAASLPEAFATAWFNIHWRSELKPTQTILIHGGSSGIGSAAIQIAKRHGAKVIASVRTSTKAQFCMDLGADLVVCSDEFEWTLQVMHFTNELGVNAIFDVLGGSYLDANLEVLAMGGSIMMVAYLAGKRAYLNIPEVMAKQAKIAGAQIRLLSPEDKSVLCTQVGKDLYTGFAENAYKPVVHSVFPLDKVQEAHELMESGNFTGKIVLSLQ